MHRSTLKLPHSAAALALAAATLAAPRPPLGRQAKPEVDVVHYRAVSGAIHVIFRRRREMEQAEGRHGLLLRPDKVDPWWPGYVQEVDVALGDCGPGQCPQFPTLLERFAGEPRLFQRGEFFVSTQRASAVDRDRYRRRPLRRPIIKECNQHLQADGPTKTYSFSLTTMPRIFRGHRQGIRDMNNAVSEANRRAGRRRHPGARHRAWNLQVPVVCDPVIKPATDDVAHDFGEFDVKNVKLFLTTYQSNSPARTRARSARR